MANPVPINILYNSDNFKGALYINNNVQSVENAYTLSTKVKINAFKMYYFNYTNLDNGRYSEVLNLPIGCSILGLNIFGNTTSTTALLKFNGNDLPLPQGEITAVYSQIGSGGQYSTLGSQSFYMGVFNLDEGDIVTAEILVLLN